MKSSLLSLLFLSIFLALAPSSWAHSGHQTTPSYTDAPSGKSSEVGGRLNLEHSDFFKQGYAKQIYTFSSGGKRYIAQRVKDRGVRFTPGALVDVKAVKKGNRIIITSLTERKRKSISKRALGTPTAAQTLVIMMNFTADTRQPFTPEQIRSTVFGASGVSAAMKEESFGQYGLTGKRNGQTG